MLQSQRNKMTLSILEKMRKGGAPSRPQATSLGGGEAEQEDQEAAQGLQPDYMQNSQEEEPEIDPKTGLPIKKPSKGFNPYGLPPTKGA